MFRLNIFDPTSTRSSIGDGSSLSNFAVVVKSEVFRATRNAALLDLHVRRSIQDRPYFYFRGAAEHTMLTPLATLISQGGDPIKFQLDFAKNLNAIAKGIAMVGRGKPSISALIATLALVPKTDAPGEFYRSTDKSTGMKSGLEVFSDFFEKLWESQQTRQTILKTYKSPSFKITGAQTIAANPVATTIEETLKMIEIFGMAGKAQPLFGQDITPILADRFMVENYLFSASKNKYEEDCKVSASIWYLMYNQIVRTPESYDAAMPLIPPTIQEAQIASQILKLLGTFTHTSIAAATAPVYIDAVIAIKQASELVEFIQTGPNYDSESIDKIKKMLAECENMITEAAYPPIVTLAKSSFDYVKKLTSARYLLPEFISDYKSTVEEVPFSPMARPTAVLVPENFDGEVKNAQRLVAFGGLDIPQLLENTKRRVFELQAGLIQISQIRTTLQSGMASQHGSVVTHLDSLGHMEADPTLGSEELHYPEITRTYLTPSYIPKYKEAANGTPEWIFSRDYMFKPFFIAPFQFQQLTENTAKQYFSWDTEVNLPPSPATGAEFATLMIPHTYVSDILTRSYTNDIASVSQFLNTSPHRPMRDLADYFTPMFRAISTGLNTDTVIANAVASMFTLYKKKKKSVGKYNDAAAWEVIKPQVPFIYGYPTKSFIDANAPWTTDDRFICTERHVQMSSDGSYMAVLHRAVPLPTKLSYIPFTMEGGIKVSLPVSTDAYSKAMMEVPKSAKTNPDTFYSEMYSRLSAAITKNNLTRVRSWSATLAAFPHIFVTNRHISDGANIILANLNHLTQRMTLHSDEAAPFGGVLSYFTSPLIGFDLKDKDEAVTTSETTIDVGSEIARKSSASKAVVNAENTELPKAQHSDIEPINKVVDTPTELPSSTEPDGSNSIEKPESPGTFMPEIDDSDKPKGE